MGIQIKSDPKKNDVIIIEAFGEINKQDYEKAMDLLDDLIESGKSSILMDLKNLDEISPGVIWQEFKLGAKHFDDLERIAIIGEKSVLTMLVKITESFSTAEIQLFESNEIDTAKQWVGKENKEEKEINTKKEL